MLRWKKWTHNKCPRCGEFEDASHVISCKVPEATALWHSAVNSLQQWMENVQTDPQVVEAILSEFKHWRNTGHEQPSMLATLAHMQQGDIGWNLALEGWLATEWEVTPQSHYDLINSRKQAITGWCRSSTAAGKLYGTYGSIEIVCCTINKIWHLNSTPMAPTTKSRLFTLKPYNFFLSAPINTLSNT